MNETQLNNFLLEKTNKDLNTWLYEAHQQSFKEKNDNKIKILQSVTQVRKA